MAWNIEYTVGASQQLKKMDRQVARQIIDFMDKRIAPLDNPRDTGKALTGPLASLWRYRVGDYRIIASIEDTAVRVLVVRIGHRKEVYRV